MRALIVSATALVLSVSAPAAANTQVIEVRIPHGDLNLGSEAGRAALEVRIDRLVRKACERRDPLGRAAAKTDRACAAGAKRDALAQIERRDNRQVAMGAD